MNERLIRVWKNFRVNLMYWRFRNITRNRLRLQSWFRRQPSLSSYRGGYRPRASAAVVYRGSSRRTWTGLIVMVLILTGLGYVGRHANISPSIIWGISSLVVVGALYWALRGV